MVKNTSKLKCPNCGNQMDFVISCDAIYFAKCFQCNKVFDITIKIKKHLIRLIKPKASLVVVSEHKFDPIVEFNRRDYILNEMTKIYPEFQKYLENTYQKNKNMEIVWLDTEKNFDDYSKNKLRESEKK